MPGAVDDRKDIKFEVFGMSGYAEAMFMVTGGSDGGGANKVPRTDDAYAMSMQDPAAQGGGGGGGGGPVTSGAPGFGPPPHLAPRVNSALYGGYQNAGPPSTGLPGVGMGMGTGPGGARAASPSLMSASGAGAPPPPPPPPGAPPPSAFIPAVPPTAAPAPAAVLNSQLTADIVAASGAAPARRGVSNLPAWLVAQQAEEAREAAAAAAAGAGAGAGGESARPEGRAAVTEERQGQGEREPQPQQLHQAHAPTAEATAGQEQMLEDFLNKTITGHAIADAGAGASAGAAGTLVAPPPPPPAPAPVPQAPYKAALPDFAPTSKSASAAAPAKLVFLWADDEFSMEERRAQRLGLLA